MERCGSRTSEGRGLRRWLVAAAFLAVALTLTACGGGSGSSSASTESGGATSASTESGGAAKESSAGSEFSIAYMKPTSVVEYATIGEKGAQAAAERYGASLDVFDAEFDGAKQASQIQQAASSGKYAGIDVVPAAGPETVCSAIKQAMAEGVVVGVNNQPACSPALTESQYTTPYPGTANFVGLQTPDFYKEWIREGLAQEPKGGQFAVITGPATQANTPRLRAVLDDMKEAGELEGWEEVGFVPGNYEASVALSKATTLLQANPEINMIFTTYTPMSQAAHQAAVAAGKGEQVKIIDLLADQTSFQNLEAGNFALTTVGLPYEESYRSVQAIIAKLENKKELDGVPVGKFWNLIEDPKLQGMNGFITPENVDKYKELGFPESLNEPESLKIVNPGE